MDDANCLPVNRVRDRFWDCFPMVWTLITPIQAASKAAASLARSCGSATIDRKGLGIYRMGRISGSNEKGPPFLNDGLRYGRKRPRRAAPYEAIRSHVLQHQRQRRLASHAAVVVIAAATALPAHPA